MAAADEALRAGCLDCLEQAFQGYLTIRSDSDLGQTATAPAARTAMLIAVR